MISFSFLAGFLFFSLPLLLAWGSCLYHLAVVVAALRFCRKPESSSGFAPPVSILKPLQGIEQNFYSSLSSFFRQDYPQFEIVFGVSDANDPALWTLRQLQKDFPQIPVKIVIVPESSWSNPKMNKLHRMIAEAAHEVVVISDADIRVDSDYLRNVVSPLADERVGLVTCLYRGVPPEQRFPVLAVLEALGISGDFAGQVLLAQALGEVRFALGATMATRKRQIAAIGGFARWADYLADDYILGNRVAAAGYRVHLSHTVVETALPRRTVSEMFQQQLRWARTIRFVSPRGYPGLLLTFGIPLAILAWASHPTSLLALATLGAVLICRWLAALVAGKVVCRDPLINKFFWLLPLRDTLALGIWFASFLGRRVVWREARFRIEADGRIRPA